MFMKLLTIIMVTAILIGGLTSSINPHEETLLEIATVISGMEHEFLLEIVGPLAVPLVPTGMSVELTIPEDMAWVLQQFSDDDWAYMLSHIDGDYLVHIMQLLEALP